MRSWEPFGFCISADVKTWFKKINSIIEQRGLVVGGLVYRVQRGSKETLDGVCMFSCNLEFLLRLLLGLLFMAIINNAQTRIIRQGHACMCC